MRGAGGHPPRVSALVFCSGCCSTSTGSQTGLQLTLTVPGRAPTLQQVGGSHREGGSTGLLEAGDAFRGTAFNMAIPLVMLVGYRGYASLEPGAERIDTAATFFEPTLKAWSIPYYTALKSEDAPLLKDALAHAQAISLPVAVTYPGELA